MCNNKVSGALKLYYFYLLPPSAISHYSDTHWELFVSNLLLLRTLKDSKFAH